jgi:RND family efflux transporter MFP subunit
MQAFFKRCAAVATIVVVAVIAGAPPTLGQGGPPTIVRVDATRMEQAEQSMPVIGRLVAKRAGDVAARSEGLVESLLADVGDRVEANAIVATLKRDLLTAERDRRAAETVAAESAVTAARAELGLRRQEFSRLERLKKSPAFSVGQFDDKSIEVQMARSMLAEAQGNLSQSRAQVQLAEIALEDAEIRAPYAGVVTRTHVEIGEYVQVGEPIIRLVDDSDLEIEADVPGIRQGALAPGVEVIAEVLDTRFPATVRAVLPEENQRTRTRIVRFVSDFDGVGNLAANQDVIVRIPVGSQSEVLTVHKDAVLHRGGRYEVFVAINGTATLRPVDIGEAIGTRFEVRDGLMEGDLVVVRGNERLFPGQPITVGNEPKG